MKQLYFMLLSTLLLCTGLHGQTPSPGGVGIPELWFKTVAKGDDLQGQYYWRDFGGDSIKLHLYDSRGATYGNEYRTSRAQVRTYNFNPALDLSEVNASKQFVLEKSNLSQATIISVWGPDYGAFDRDMFLYVLNGRPGNGYIFTKDKIIHSNESGKGIFDYGKEEGKDLLYQPTDEEASVSKFRERALKIATYNRILQPNTSVWGERNRAIISIGEIFHPGYSFNTSTFNTGELNNRAFYGYTPEFIVYNRILTPLERRKAETYLALKYGLTLERSYISSKDALLWDIDQNSAFNHRVTGYGRDDASGLHQTMATTSYEEAPYYSDDYNDLYDSYDLNNSYHLPSRYRLLVMGREPASPVRDGDFILFGDNDQTIAASDMEGVNGIRLMSRRWLLNTNATPVAEGEKHFEWRVQDLDVYTDGFKTKATKTGSEAAASGSLVTQRPLLEKDGYFSWIISSTRRGPLTVKFGTDNPQVTGGENDYGYYLSYRGRVYKIIKGVREPAWIATVSANRKVEVGKEDNTVYLRVNGVRTHACDIEIDGANVDKDFYGSILIDKYSNDDIVLSDIRQGGFSNTGNRVELSYIVERAYGFRDYRSGGKSYLVIDRTGTGDFSSEHVEYIPSDEPDENRYKIIFNNIFWDTDGNGRDMFTFGYRPSNLVAVVRAENPTCLNDSSLQEGVINVKIIQGFPGFSYKLENLQTNDIQSGTLYCDSVKIENLPAGVYDLTLWELGGFNLYPRQAGNYGNEAIGSAYFNSTSNAYLEWTFTNGTQASVGMSMNASLQRSPDNQHISYGLHVSGGNLYQIDNSTAASVPLAAVSPGDRIRVERVSNNIYYKLNGQDLLAVPVRSEDRLRYNYPYAAVSSGGIYNLTWNRMSNTASWVTTDNLAMEKSEGDGFLQTITLESGCDSMESKREEKEPQTPQMGGAEKKSRLLVYYKDLHNRRDVTARIELPEPEAVSLVVFDISGRRVHSISIPKGSSTVTADIHLPNAGMYIIKVLTSDGEYTAKVISS